VVNFRNRIKSMPLPAKPALPAGVAGPVEATVIPLFFRGGFTQEKRPAFQQAFSGIHVNSQNE
jgi:hypothetical protein